jgi:pimeloyl-ACP methyl ester carboxylesterase
LQKPDFSSGTNMKKKHKLLRRSLMIFLLFLLSLPLMTRCLPFRMSDGKVKTYFKNFSPQPSFHTYALDKKRIHYARTGNDTLPTVIFIHGSPGSWDNFIAFFKDDTLLKIARLVAADRPGFGKSDIGFPEISVEEQARLLSPLLRLGKSHRRPILVGHSYGGPVATRLAMDFPEEVGGLILVAGSVAPDLEPHEWYRNPLKVLGKTGMLADEINASNLEIMALKAELTRMLPLWKNITCPVTVLQGDADVLVSPGNAAFVEKMLAGKPDIKIRMLPKVNHFIPWSHPQEIRRAILEHLAFPK